MKTWTHQCSTKDCPLDVTYQWEPTTVADAVPEKETTPPPAIVAFLSCPDMHTNRYVIEGVVTSTADTKWRDQPGKIDVAEIMYTRSPSRNDGPL